MKKKMKQFWVGILTMALVIGMLAGVGTMKAEAGVGDEMLCVYAQDTDGNPIEGLKFILKGADDSVYEFLGDTDEDGYAELDLMDFADAGGEAGTYYLETATGSGWVCSEQIGVVIAELTSWGGLYIDTVGGEEYSSDDGYTLVVKQAENGGDTPTPSEAKIESISVSPEEISRKGQKVTVTVKGENLPSILYYKRSYSWGTGSYSAIEAVDSEGQPTAELTGTESERTFEVDLTIQDYDYKFALEYYLEIATSAESEFSKATIQLESLPSITEVSVPENTTIGKEGGTVTVTVKGSKLPDELYYRRNHKWGDELADGTVKTLGPVEATGTAEEKTIEVELPAVSGTYANARQWTIQVGSTDLGYKPSNPIVIPIEGVAESPKIESVVAPEKVSADGEEIEVTVNGAALSDKAYYKISYVYEMDGTETTGSISNMATETALSGENDKSKTFRVEIPKKEDVEKEKKCTIKAWKIQVNLDGVYAPNNVSSNKIAIVEGTIVPPEKTEIEGVTYSITEAKRTGDEVKITVTGTALPDNFYYVISYKKANGEERYAGEEQQITATGTPKAREFTVGLPAVSEYPEAVAWRVGVNTESNDGYYFQKAGMADKDISIAPDNTVTEETKTALNTAIAEASSLKEADYTAESWKAYAEAIAAANELTNKENATETEYQKAIQAINNAKAALKEAGKTEEKPTEQPVVKDVKVSKLTLSGISKKIAAGKKIQLTAAVAPSNASNKAVTWKTSNKKYATVSSTGKVTVKKAGAGKTVTITATAKDGSGVKATYKIKIMKNAVKSIKLKAAKSVKAGKSLKVKATVKTTGKKVNKTLKWTSSNTKYATVNSKGKVTAKKAGKGKTVKITAKSTDGTNKKKTVKIKIK